MRDRAVVCESFADARVVLRGFGIHRTEDDISFFDDNLDMDHLDEVVASLRD